jgi:pyrimidine oxygenase
MAGKLPSAEILLLYYQMPILIRTQISRNSPKYKPTFELNKVIVQKAEKYGFNFALSMIKLRGFGGETEHWDYNLESFTLMAGLAAVTSKIKLFASTAILTLPPAIAGMPLA